MTRAVVRSHRTALAFWLGLGGLFVVTTTGTLLAWASAPALLAPWRSSVVESGSMAPAIRTGDIVVWRVAPGAAPDVDTVMLFVDELGRPTLHRVVERREDGWVRTQGDANPTPDAAWVAPEQVQGYGQLLVPVVGLPRVWWQHGHRLRAVAAVVAVALSAWASRAVWRGECDPWAAARTAHAVTPSPPGILVDLRDQIAVAPPVWDAPVRGGALAGLDDDPDELFPPDVLRLLLTTYRATP